MESGDGLVVRVRAPGGRLTQAQATGIAALAERCGNGLLDLSARANLQLRGVSETTHPAVLEGLAGLGLLDADPEAEARRNVLVTPFADAATDTLAAALGAALAEAGDLSLPGKFGFAVDCGPAPVLVAASADIRLERAGQGLLLRADGMAAGKPVAEAAAVPEALALARWFHASGGAVGGRGRMAALIARGARPGGHDIPAPAPAEASRPGLVASGALVGAAFGVIEAAQLAALAVLGPLRLTPWRMLLIEGARTMPQVPGLVTDPADPMLHTSACTGAPGCPQALGPTRGLARRLAPHVAGLHVSGCAKGCAHPGPARVTLVAAGAGLYDLVRDGPAGALPLFTGLMPDAIEDHVAQL